MENVRGAAKRPAGAPSQKPTPSGGIRTAIRDHFRAISPADSSRRVARTPPSPRPAARLELPSARWTTKAPHPFALRHGALLTRGLNRYSRAVGGTALATGPPVQGNPHGTGGAGAFRQGPIFRNGRYPGTQQAPTFRSASIRGYPGRSDLAEGPPNRSATGSRLPTRRWDRR